MAAGPDPDPGASGGRRRQRALLSVFFLLHWGAVAAYVLPATRAALEPLPAWMRSVAGFVFPRAVLALTPVAIPYLDMTGTRQHWRLFAPNPADWTGSVRVVPYFRVSSATEPGRWVSDTIVLRGPREAGYPHYLHHRTYRILFNLGYDDWGRAYRPIFAREMCRTLRSTDGRAPEGLSLVATWEPIRLPWESDEAEPYVQWMGGYDCPHERPDARRAPWPAYGIPPAIDVSGWPLVLDTLPADSAGRPPGGHR